MVSAIDVSAHPFLQQHPPCFPARRWPPRRKPPRHARHAHCKMLKSPPRGLGAHNESNLFWLSLMLTVTQGKESKSHASKAHAIYSPLNSPGVATDEPDTTPEGTKGPAASKRAFTTRCTTGMLKAFPIIRASWASEIGDSTVRSSGNPCRRRHSAKERRRPYPASQCPPCAS